MSSWRLTLRLALVVFLSLEQPFTAHARGSHDVRSYVRQVTQQRIWQKAGTEPMPLPSLDSWPPPAAFIELADVLVNQTASHPHAGPESRSSPHFTPVHPNVRTAMCRKHQISDIGSGVTVQLRMQVETRFIKQLIQFVVNKIIEPVLNIIVYLIMVCLVVLLMELFSDRIFPLLALLLPDVLEMMLPMLLENEILEPLERALPITLTDKLGARLSAIIEPIIVEQLSTFTLFISDPDVSHAVPHLVSNRIAGPIASQLRRELTRSLTHYITHKTTHGIIHEYYCQWCHWYNEYCEYCFYYDDFKWMHQMFSMGGEDDQSGNPFGGVMTSEFT